MENEINNEKMICEMLEIQYMKQMSLYVESKNTNLYTVLYPFEWFSNKNYIKKIEILKEAIENKILIIKTKSYQDIIEGVKYNIDD